MFAVVGDVHRGWPVRGDGLARPVLWAITAMVHPWWTGWILQVPKIYQVVRPNARTVTQK